MTIDEAKAEFWRQWAIAGMPGDKKRLAEAAWNAALAAAPSPPSGWLDIESAPKDGSDILGFCGDRCYVMSWEKATKCWYFAWHDFDGPVEVDSPTHWMPLPPPPEERT